MVRAFAHEDGAALVHLHNVSGGLLGGDELGLEVSVGEEAKVQLTTTSATRIYRAREDSRTTNQQNHIEVGENALLEYVPDAMIPFAGSRYRQETTIHLAEGAGLYWWEIIGPGREASGELFEYEQFEMRTKISACGRTIAAENILLSPAKRNIESLARLGPYRYSATFYICAVDRKGAAWRIAEEKLRSATAKLAIPCETLWGVSTLRSHGLVVRCMARNGGNVLPGLYSIWKQAKALLHCSAAISPRKLN